MMGIIWACCDFEIVGLTSHSTLAPFTETHHFDHKRCDVIQWTETEFGVWIGRVGGYHGEM